MRSRLVLGALVGLTAALVGLGAAELLAATSNTFQSPVLDVADRVVDGVPNWLKELAIDWFGTNDKVALLVGIGTILTLYALAVGVFALGANPWPARVGIGAFGIVGAYASQSTRRDAPWTAMIPSLVGAAAAVATVVVLQVLWRRWRATTADGEGDAGAPLSIAQLVPNERRRFLAGLGLFAVAGVAMGTTGRQLATRGGAASSRAALELPRADRALAPAPSGIVATPSPTTARPITPFFTPNTSFYRIDTAITVPQVPAEDWELLVHGLVDRPLRLTYDDLVRRELVEADITLTCVSNEVGGSLVGTARWLGVRLDSLLDDAGVDPSADQVVGRSVDGYTCGFPVSVLDGRDALVAIGMNGEPLPLQHGFPARLIVPGLYGYVSATKWLTEIELTRFDAFDQYWVERGWAEEAPIHTQSRIDTPRGLDTVAAGPVAIGGVAWAQTRGVTRVEVQIDDGEWAGATLADELNDVTWRQWWFRWDATPGRHTIRVRATDGDGDVQTPDRQAPFPSGATGQHQIVVIAE